MRIFYQNLCKNHQTGNGSISALEDVTFQVEDNEFVCIAGKFADGVSRRAPDD